MFETLPRTFEAVQDWQWENYQPYSDDLLARDLNAAVLDQFMRDYSDFEALLYEHYVRLDVSMTRNTADEALQQKHAAFMEKVYPPAMSALNALRKKLVDSGLQPADFAVALRNWKVQIETFRDENMPLLAEENRLGTEYDKLIGAQMVEWEGEKITVTRLLPIQQNPDRQVREKAWRLSIERGMQDRNPINEVWGKLLETRHQVGENADTDYRSWIWKQKARFDYSPQDCEAFHRAVEQTVTPLLARLYAKRRQSLGVDTLRPWDIDVDPNNLPALKPFANAQELVEKSSIVFHKIDPVFGGYFDFMRENDLLDLENRPNKAPGGYQAVFLIKRQPFIFMNTVGVQRDLETLMHEGGHAFHQLEMAKLPYVSQSEVTQEFSEVASMAMELLSTPYWTEFYSPKEAARARIKHLEGMLRIWITVASGDAFQHWIYTNLEDAKDPVKCDEKWRELRQRFNGGAVDWSGLDAENAAQWHRILHFFKVPFYLIEYGLAQLGAVQVWANSLENYPQAVADYRKALALGNTVPIPELFAAAGAKFAFDVPTFQRAVDLIERTITELEAV